MNKVIKDQVLIVYTDCEIGKIFVEDGIIEEVIDSFRYNVDDTQDIPPKEQLKYYIGLRLRYRSRYLKIADIGMRRLYRSLKQYERRRSNLNRSLVATPSLSLYYRVPEDDGRLSLRCCSDEYMQTLSFCQVYQGPTCIST
jgi:hypothetical protein